MREYNFLTLSLVRTEADFRTQKRNETALELASRIRYFRTHPVAALVVARGRERGNVVTNGVAAAGLLNHGRPATVLVTDNLPITSSK